MKDLHWDHNNHIIWFCPYQTLEYDLFTVLWWFICGWTDCEMPLSNESGNYIIVSLWSKKSLLFFSPSPLQWINNEDKAVNKRRQIDRIFFSYAITRRIVLSGFLWLLGCVRNHVRLGLRDIIIWKHSWTQFVSYYEIPWKCPKVPLNSPTTHWLIPFDKSM